MAAFQSGSAEAVGIGAGDQVAAEPGDDLDIWANIPECHGVRVHGVVSILPPLPIRPAGEHRSSQSMEKRLCLQGRGWPGAESIGLRPSSSIHGTNRGEKCCQSPLSGPRVPRCWEGSSAGTKPHTPPPPAHCSPHPRAAAGPSWPNWAGAELPAQARGARTEEGAGLASLTALETRS